MKRVIVQIDGGHLRAQARRDGVDYTVDLIEDFAHAVLEKQEELVRVFYYDCRPFQGEAQLPVSGDTYHFKSGGGWLDELASRDYLCVRTGMLKFRGWKPKMLPMPTGGLTDQHFRPDFEQKGIDLQLGLDLTQVIDRQAADRVVLVAADTDLIPAMARARNSSVQLIGIDFPNAPLHGEILAHFDVMREVEWPKPDPRD
ncbi:NYN domain-containing protein [Pedomonas mirosovicensis]|uniref:NYN domain-containing protein n=1 Tax=Pedomonas mirosovicensis TaxID=2908641 RepID=UPI002168618E|nr:NYN domain-containing protein [Pedomonas mirosovicensis]MCH8686146.1 NYN domain-containing protein [Pedomonas mirosovicensis]